MLQGLAYPLRPDPLTGGLALESDSELIRDHLLSFLKTETGERVMLASYGIPHQLFKSYTDLLVANAQLSLRLESWIPQATFRCDATYENNGEVLLNIFWTLRDSTSVENNITISWGDFK